MSGFEPAPCNVYYHDSVMVPPALLFPQGCFGYSDPFVLSEFFDCSLYFSEAWCGVLKGIELYLQT